MVAWIDCISSTLVYRVKKKIFQKDVLLSGPSSAFPHCRPDPPMTILTVSVRLEGSASVAHCHRQSRASTTLSAHVLDCFAIGARACLAARGRSWHELAGHEQTTPCATYCASYSREEFFFLISFLLYFFFIFIKIYFPTNYMSFCKCVNPI